MLRLAHGVAALGGGVFLLGFLAFAQPHICESPCRVTPIQQHLWEYLGPGFSLLLLAWVVLVGMAARSHHWRWLSTATLGTVLSALVFGATVVFLAPLIAAHPELSVVSLIIVLWWTYQLVITRPF